MTPSGKRKIVVDFEWAKTEQKIFFNGKVLKQEIIEFGAVMLDADFKELGNFKCYVKPRYMSKLTDTIINLTGITDDLLADARDFSEVLKEFVDWCENGQGKYEVYAWSDNDLIQVRKEIEAKGIARTDAIRFLLGNWYDLQKEFDSMLGFKSRVSLENALFTAGIDLEGKAHDALDDARNTAQLICFMNDPEKQETIIRKIREVLCGTDEKATLGEMFDMSMFSGLPEE